jgi:hypothetical protein
MGESWAQLALKSVQTAVKAGKNRPSAKFVSCKMVLIVLLSSLQLQWYLTE